MNKEEQILRLKLIEAIDVIFESTEMENFDCWYGEKQVERMADAALAVLMSTKEAQDYLKKEGVMQ